MQKKKEEISVNLSQYHDSVEKSFTAFLITLKKRKLFEEAKESLYRLFGRVEDLQGRHIRLKQNMASNNGMGSNR